MAFPTNLTNAVNNVTDADAAHINNLEAKVGIDGSAVTTSHDYKLSAVTSSAKAVSTEGTQTVNGVKTFGDGIATDTISEETSAAGVTIDGVKLKDSQVVTDTIIEKTSAAGVTIDGVLLKDSQVTTDVINEASAGTGVTVDGVLLKDSKVTATALMTTAWTTWTPSLSGSGGSAGAYAQDSVSCRYCIIGKVCYFYIHLRITNKGSWSGDVRVTFPVTVSANLTADQYMMPSVVITPQSGGVSPLEFSKGIGVINATTYFKFTDNMGASVLQWAAVSNNDYIVGQAFAELD